MTRSFTTVAVAFSCLASAFAQTPPPAPSAAPGATAAAPAGDALHVVFRPSKKFYSLEEPIEIGVLVENRGAAAFDTKGLSLDNDLVVKDRTGKSVEKSGSVDAVGATMPASLGPGERGIRTIDLRPAYPALTPGCYTLEWKNPRVVSVGPEIRISTPYDATKDYDVTLHTSMGDMTLALARDKAPNHVFSFVQLVTSRFYDGLTFHRVKAGAIIQGGDPKGDGTGTAGYMIKAEKNDLKHERAALVMASGASPDSASSQFYICLAPLPDQEGKDTVFGTVVAGMDVADAIGKVATGPGDRPTTPVTITSATASVRAAGAAPSAATPPAATPAATPAKP